VILIFAVFVLLLAEAALVAFVFISPNASERLESVGVTVQRVWDGSNGQPGLRERAAETAGTVYQRWVEPLWQEPAVPSVNPEFTSCVDCHPDYASQRRFGVYMDHPLHAEIGVECVTCHPTNPHPDPPLPLEKVCADCHAEVNQKDGCGYCHPPASLPHFYYLGAPKNSVVECEVCHPKNTFAGANPDPKVFLSNFDGSNRETCLACHQEKSCALCHGAAHPADWITTHGAHLVTGSAATCYTCHTSSWCSDRCHSVTDTYPFATRPVPEVGVRP
jgi:hypothetical protein